MTTTRSRIFGIVDHAAVSITATEDGFLLTMILMPIVINVFGILYILISIFMVVVVIVDNIIGVNRRAVIFHTFLHFVKETLGMRSTLWLR